MFDNETMQIREQLISQGYRLYHGNFAVSAWAGDRCVASAYFPVGVQGPCDATPEIRRRVYGELAEAVRKAEIAGLEWT
jgi:hypothetical protein